MLGSNEVEDELGKQGKWIKSRLIKFNIQMTLDDQLDPASLYNVECITFPSQAYEANIFIY